MQCHNPSYLVLARVFLENNYNNYMMYFKLDLLDSV